MDMRKGFLVVTTASALAAVSGCAVFDEEKAQARLQEPERAERTAQAETPPPWEEEQTAQAQQPQQQQQQAASQQPEQQTAAAQQQPQVPPPAPSSLITEIQQTLNEAGHDLAVDGIWGPETHQAITQFQEENNLEGDGQLSLATLREMDVQAGVQAAEAPAQPAAAEPQPAVGGGATQQQGAGAGGTAQQQDQEPGDTQQQATAPQAQSQQPGAEEPQASQ